MMMNAQSRWSSSMKQQLLFLLFLLSKPSHTFSFGSTACRVRQPATPCSFPVVFSSARCTVTTPLSARSNSEEENLDIESLLLTSVPGVPNRLAVVMLPLVLGSWVVWPGPQALLTLLLFGLFRTLAVHLILFPTTLHEDVYGIKEENVEEKAEQLEVLQIDVTCFLLAGFSAGIMAPDEWSSLYPAVLLMGVVAVWFLRPLQEIKEEEQLSRDEKLLNRWDQKLDKSDD